MTKPSEVTISIHFGQAAQRAIQDYINSFNLMLESKEITCSSLPNEEIHDILMRHFRKGLEDLLSNLIVTPLDTKTELTFDIPINHNPRPKIHPIPIDQRMR